MKPSLRSQRGQGITEAILILVMLMGFTMIVGNYFKKQEIVKQLVTGPWQDLAGMMQNGLWKSRDAGATAHPTGHFRHISIQGVSAQ